MSYLNPRPEPSHVAPLAEQAPTDEPAFVRHIERHRRELQVHCYRMLGSFEDSEDLVQETFLRAWRGRHGFKGTSTMRAWLYRIATNACLDFLSRHARWPLTHSWSHSVGGAPAPDDVPWLQPYPDHLLDLAEPSGREPDAVVVAKETIELAFLVAVQHLPPRQRAVLILRDILGQSASDTAGVLELSVPAVNSALQRARIRLREHLPRQRSQWTPEVGPTQAEKALARRYIAAVENADVDAMAQLLHDDVRATMPMPQPCEPSQSGLPSTRWIGRAAYLAGFGMGLDPASPAYFGQWLCIPTQANRQPAIACYTRHEQRDVWQAQVIDVLQIRGDKIVEITAFGPENFTRFGLPLTR